MAGARLSTTTPIRQRAEARSRFFTSPIQQSIVLAVQVFTLEFDRKDKNTGAEGLLTFLVNLVTGHAGVAYPALVSTEPPDSPPQVTEIFGDYPTNEVCVITSETGQSGRRSL